MPARRSTPSNCNQKLIGARYYNAGYGGNAGIKANCSRTSSTRRATADGHGTHTASTAGGNANVAGHRRGSGVRQHQRHRAARPHRRLQGLLGQNGRGRLLRRRQRRGHRPGRGRRRGRHQLLDQRHAARTSVDPVEIAFLFAADAGVFVAASAGNSGPTVQHRGAPQPVDHHGGGGHAQPRWRGLGDARQRRDVQRRLGRRRRWPAAVDRLGRRRPARRRPERRWRCATALPTAACRARPGQGGRQDRGLRPRRHRPRRTRAWPCRRPAVSAWCWSTPRPTRSMPTSTRCPRCTCRAPTARRSRPMRRPRAPRRPSTQATIVCQRAGAVHGLVLVARPAAGRQRRPAQARPDRAGPGHPGRGVAVGYGGRAVRPAERHVDVQPARGRHRGADEGAEARTGRRWRSSRR